MSPLLDRLSRFLNRQYRVVVCPFKGFFLRVEYRSKMCTFKGWWKNSLPFFSEYFPYKEADGNHSSGGRLFSIIFQCFNWCSKTSETKKGTVNSFHLSMGIQGVFFHRISMPPPSDRQDFLSHLYYFFLNSPLAHAADSQLRIESRDGQPLCGLPRPHCHTYVLNFCCVVPLARDFHNQ